MALTQETNCQKLSASCMLNQVLSSLLKKKEKEENGDIQFYCSAQITKLRGVNTTYVKVKGIPVGDGYIDMLSVV